MSRRWLLTFSVTIGANRLHLLDHSGRQLSDHDPHAAAPTRCTLLHGARLPALPAATRKETSHGIRKDTCDQGEGGSRNAHLTNVPITGAAEHVLAQLELGRFAVVEVLQRNPGEKQERCSD